MHSTRPPSAYGFPWAGIASELAARLASVLAAGKGAADMQRVVTELQGLALAAGTATEGRPLRPAAGRGRRGLEKETAPALLGVPLEYEALPWL